jgi:Sulfatase-modifying factor enzyme 1
LSRLPPPTLPRWSIGVTVASVALFVAGLIVYFGRSVAPVGEAGVAGSVDAAPSSPAISMDAPPGGAANTPPVGMILVKDRTGRPWFYVDARPVSAEAFRSVFATHTQKPRLDGNPVLGVSYTVARSYAKTVKARLLTAAEWDQASTMPGFLVNDGLYEWVESDGARRIAKRHGGNDGRKDQEYSDVTFRLARDLR